jgi:hypothetical protein
MEEARRQGSWLFKGDLLTVLTLQRGDLERFVHGLELFKGGSGRGAFTLAFLV